MPWQKTHMLPLICCIKLLASSRDVGKNDLFLNKDSKLQRPVSIKQRKTLTTKSQTLFTQTIKLQFGYQEN